MTVMSDQVRFLPDGSSFVFARTYLSTHAKSGLALLVVSSIALVALIGLTVVIAVSVFNTRGSKDTNLFIRTHVGIYFISLVIALVFQAVGTLMSARWIVNTKVEEGSFCSSQGIIKHIADVSIPIWTFIIVLTSAMELRKSRRESKSDQKEYKASLHGRVVAKCATTVAAWSLIIVIFILGAATADTHSRGSYYGVSGDWCWITDSYVLEKIIFAYFIMFSLALVSFMISLGTFLRLREDLRKRSSSSKYVFSEQGQVDEYNILLVKHMILYPLAYFICLFPIAVVRFADWSGKPVSYSVVIFADSIYLSIGIVTVVIFLLSPKILPPRTYLPKWTISNPIPQDDVEPQQSSGDSYHGAEKPLSNITSARASAYLTSQAPLSSVPYPARVHGLGNPFATPLLPDDYRSSVSSVTTLASQQPNSGNGLHPAGTDRTPTRPYRIPTPAHKHSSFTPTTSGLSVSSSNKHAPPRLFMGLPSGPAHHLRQASDSEVASQKHFGSPALARAFHSLSESSPSKLETSVRMSSSSSVTAASFSPIRLYGSTEGDDEENQTTGPSRGKRCGHMSHMRYDIAQLQTEIGAGSRPGSLHSWDSTASSLSYYSGDDWSSHRAVRFQLPRSASEGSEGTAGAFEIVTRPESYIVPKRPNA